MDGIILYIFTLMLIKRKGFNPFLIFDQEQDNFMQTKKSQYRNSTIRYKEQLTNQNILKDFMNILNNFIQKQNFELNDNNKNDIITIIKKVYQQYIKENEPLLQNFAEEFLKLYDSHYKQLCKSYFLDDNKKEIIEYMQTTLKEVG